MLEARMGTMLSGWHASHRLFWLSIMSFSAAQSWYMQPYSRFYLLAYCEFEFLFLYITFALSLRI